MHFEILFVNFEVFDVLFNLYVHTYIVSFQFYFFKHILNLNFVYITLLMLFHLFLFFLKYELSFQSSIFCISF
jgi:hypothetical protein